MDQHEITPNAGRVYDYILGGHHNFEADRVVAERVLQLMPSMKNAMRLNRWFMHHAVIELVGGGFGHFIDMATGLPTEGYIHDLAPDALVLYNDRDPVTVAYGKQIVGDNPKVRYVQADLNNVEVVLEAADEHFKGERLVAICFVGVAYFLTNDQIRHVLDALYNWCASGSQMAISSLHINDSHPRVQQIQALFDQMGNKAHSRSPEALTEFLATTGWDIQEPGVIPASKWMETPTWYDPADAEMFELFGVMVKKP